MHVLSIDVTDFLPFFIFAIPIVAIVGGITAGIVRTIGQQRLIELAQRERIAAVERGVDPSKLPPLPGPASGLGARDWWSDYPSSFDPRRRAQGLMIGGVITLAVGISLAIFLHLVADEPNVWAVGLIPGSVGIALLLSAWIVHPRGGDRGAGSPPQT